MCVLVSGGGTPVHSACCHALVHVQANVPLQRSRHDEAPNDRASVRLLHGARRRRTHGACSSLAVALRCRVLTATHLCTCR